MIDDHEGSLERLANEALVRRPCDRVELPITPRMLDALAAMSRGLSYDEAAAEMNVGLETIKEHLKRARRRLDARNTNHAIAEAIRRGLIP